MNNCSHHFEISTQRHLKAKFSGKWLSGESWSGEVSYSGMIHNTALYRSAKPDFLDPNSPLLWTNARSFRLRACSNNIATHKAFALSRRRRGCSVPNNVILNSVTSVLPIISFCYLPCSVFVLLPSSCYFIISMGVRVFVSDTSANEDNSFTNHIR